MASARLRHRHRHRHDTTLPSPASAGPGPCVRAYARASAPTPGGRLSAAAILPLIRLHPPPPRSPPPLTQPEPTLRGARGFRPGASRFGKRSNRNRPSGGFPPPHPRLEAPDRKRRSARRPRKRGGRSKSGVQKDSPPHACAVAARPARSSPPLPPSLRPSRKSALTSGLARALFLLLVASVPHGLASPRRFDPPRRGSARPLRPRPRLP